MVATDDSQGNLEAVLVDASGAAGDRYPLDGSLATSPEGDVVAWVAPDGTVRAVDDGGSRRGRALPRFRRPARTTR